MSDDLTTDASRETRVLTYKSPRDPALWCVVVRLPYGVSAWAIYRGGVVQGHGTRHDSPEETLAHARSLLGERGGRRVGAS